MKLRRRQFLSLAVGPAREAMASGGERAGPVLGPVGGPKALRSLRRTLPILSRNTAIQRRADPILRFLYVPGGPDNKNNRRICKFQAFPSRLLS